MLIPFDAPFVPDDDEDRLNADGSRNLTGLIVEIKQLDQTNLQRWSQLDKPTEYEVLF